MSLCNECGCDLDGYEYEVGICPHCFQYHHYAAERLECAERRLAEALDDNRRLRQKLREANREARRGRNQARYWKGRANRR